jgi:GNAT superfamily N-acetyltransferase
MSEREGRLLRAASIRFAVVDPQSEVALSSMTAYFDELDQRFPTGFDPGDTRVVDAPNFRRPYGVFVAATLDDEVAACGGVQTLEAGIGEIKRMWVARDWRGLGIGRRMLAELEAQCLLLGNHTVRLDTNSALTEAITMYETAGYLSIERYNDNPFAKRWFEKQLIDKD